MGDMERVGIIDIGTVTVRAGVADIVDGKVQAMVRESAICNLGEGVDATGLLGPEACARVMAAVEDFLPLLEERDCLAVGCFLTSAARDADNVEELLSMLRDKGLAPTVVPGNVEGALAFRGAAQLYDDPIMAVADIGGGSCEITYGGTDDGTVAVDWSHSFDLGARRITERYLPGDGVPGRDRIVEAAARSRMALETQIPWMDGTLVHPDRLVACGGTVTTLVAIKLGLDPYDSALVEGAELTMAEVDAMAADLAKMTVAERAEVVGVQPQRAPVILGGALLVGELMRACGFRKLTVSEADGLMGSALCVLDAVHGTAGPAGFMPEVAKLGDGA